MAEKFIVFGGNYYSLPPSSCWLVWDKDNGNSDFADCELAWTNLKKAVRKFRWRWNGMLQEDMRSKEQRFYPTQKPLALMKWCIKQAGSVLTILDPFMGSGTTLVAAMTLGCKGIGIDKREVACEIAVKRVEWKRTEIDQMIIKPWEVKKSDVKEQLLTLNKKESRNG